MRWCAADSEDELLRVVPAALAAAVGEPEVPWKVPGPVVLFDAAWPGTACEHGDHLRVDLEPGRYEVRAARVEPGPETWVGLALLRRQAH